MKYRALCLSLLVASPALAATRPRPRPTVVGPWKPAPPQTGSLRLRPPHRVIYMQRAGGHYTMGAVDDNPDTNTSTIQGTTGNVSAFGGNDAAWAEVMACMRIAYAPFNVEVTDVPPVPGTQYIESVVGGDPAEVGMGPDVGGVAPGTCVTLERTVVFTFSAVWFEDPVDVCETAAQETAHAFGLDHELNRCDPMTYLLGCHPKSFKDVDSNCGEDTPRGCRCGGGSTQNSFQALIAAAGAADHILPTGAITFPADGATVNQGFSVRGDASDDVEVAKVDLWIDGVFVLSGTGTSFSLMTPNDLATGEHQIEVRVYDPGANFASDMITVNVIPACSIDADCAEGQQCLSGACLEGLGGRCSVHDDCASALCLQTDDGRKCSSSCNDTTACPDGFACQAAGGTSTFCFAEEGGGGCASAPSGRAPAWTLLLPGWALGLAVAFGLRRRRR